MKLSLLLAQFCAYLTLSTALPVNDYAVELLSPRATAEKRAIFVDYSLGDNEHACFFRVNPLQNGWFTEFGPWEGRCNELIYSQTVIQESQHNRTYLTIDLTIGLITVDSDYYGTFSCYSSVGHNQGCDEWHHVPRSENELAKRDDDAPPPVCQGIRATKSSPPEDVSNYILHKQITPHINCNGVSTCTFTQSQYHTFTIGFQTDSGPDVTDWITAGLNVAKSTTTGQSEACSGAKQESVCIFSKHVYACYWVQTGYVNSCTGEFSKNASRSRLCSVVKNSESFNCASGEGCKDPGFSYETAN